MLKTVYERLFSSIENLCAPNLSEIEYKIFSLKEEKDVLILEQLISENTDIQHHDEILSQCKELVKIDNPTKKFAEKELEEVALAYLKEQGGAYFGNYVYYPWSKKLIRILPEEAFFKLRTSRNKHKITEQEQQTLRNKTVGVIGLSVGQSVAITMCIERTFGTIRIADFDTLELSNLNRIRKGVDYLGVSKTTMVAREIAEIDPYLNVEIFKEGITPENLNTFLGEGEHQLDLLVEECDAFPIKVKARKAARAKGIPVIMDTSDKGMLDIERFDLEANRPLFHGLVEEKALNNLAALNEMQRTAILFKVVGGESLSNRLKASLIEMNQTLTSWPQLASSVALGGAITTDAVRRILLGKPVKSGRIYIDLETLIPEEKANGYMPPKYLLPDEELRHAAIEAYSQKITSNTSLSIEEVHFIVEQAGKAPSSGNDQPWEFVYKNNLLFVFHRKDKSFSFGDFEDLASIQSIGAALENLRIAAEVKGYGVQDHFIEQEEPSLLKVVVQFIKKESPSATAKLLLPAIEKRTTNRVISPKLSVSNELLQKLKATGEEVKGTTVLFETDTQKLEQLGRIVSACDKIRVLNPWGHYDFFTREMRWTPEQAEKRADGIDIRSLEIAPEMMGAIAMLKEEEVIDTLRAVKGGDGFNEISMQSFRTASAVGLVLRPKYGSKEFYEGGKAWERLWLQATMEGLSIHPLIAPLYLFPRVIYGKGIGLNEHSLKELKVLREQFLQLWSLDEGLGEVFMFKLFKTDYTPVKSYRLPVNKILVTDA